MESVVDVGSTPVASNQNDPIAGAQTHSCAHLPSNLVSIERSWKKLTIDNFLVRSSKFRLKNFDRGRKIHEKSRDIEVRYRDPVLTF